MRLFALNLVLAVLWGAVMGQTTAGSLAVGFVLGMVALIAAKPLLGPSPYPEKLVHAVAFAAWYLRELVVSSLRVARDVLRPRLDARPGIVAVPLDARTDAEITLCANLVSLTPGTLSLDLSPDRRTLYVHALDVGADADSVRREVKDELERRVLRLMRWES